MNIKQQLEKVIAEMEDAYLAKLAEINRNRDEAEKLAERMMG